MMHQASTIPEPYGMRSWEFVVKRWIMRGQELVVDVSSAKLDRLEDTTIQAKTADILPPSIRGQCISEATHCDSCETTYEWLEQSHLDHQSRFQP